MTQEAIDIALKWFAENLDKFEDTYDGIKLLIPVDEAPKEVLEYIKADNATHENFKNICQTKKQLNLK